jgi:hypothetical protein
MTNMKDKVPPKENKTLQLPSYEKKGRMTSEAPPKPTQSQPPAKPKNSGK